MSDLPVYCTYVVFNLSEHFLKENIFQRKKKYNTHYGSKLQLLRLGFTSIGVLILLMGFNVWESFCVYSGTLMNKGVWIMLSTLL